MDEILDVLDILPPNFKTCPQCADRHEDNEPHNRNSLYYQMVFYRKNGRLPTWKDAMSHCCDSIQQQWMEKLKGSINIGE